MLQANARCPWRPSSRTARTPRQSGTPEIGQLAGDLRVGLARKQRARVAALARNDLGWAWVGDVPSTEDWHRGFVCQGGASVESEPRVGRARLYRGGNLGPARRLSSACLVGLPRCFTTSRKYSATRIASRPVRGQLNRKQMTTASPGTMQIAPDGTTHSRRTAGLKRAQRGAFNPHRNGTTMNKRRIEGRWPLDPALRVGVLVDRTGARTRAARQDLGAGRRAAARWARPGPDGALLGRGGGDPRHRASRSLSHSPSGAEHGALSVSVARARPQRHRARTTRSLAAALADYDVIHTTDGVFAFARTAARMARRRRHPARELDPHHRALLRARLHRGDHRTLRGRRTPRAPAGRCD